MKPQENKRETVRSLFRTHSIDDSPQPAILNPIRC
jgi:hypothetical protein